MEKNVKLAALASTAILGVTAVMPVIANASTKDNASANSQAQTNATVSFKQNANNSSSVPPVSSNGSQGSNGSEGGATGQTGDLTIDYITPNLNFGNHELSKDKHQAISTGISDTAVTNGTSTTDNIYNANYLDGNAKGSAKDPATGADINKDGKNDDPGTGDQDTKDGFNGYYDNNVWLQFSKRQSEEGTDTTDTKDSSLGYNVTATMSDFEGTTQAATGDILKGAQINFTTPNGKYYFDQKNILKDDSFTVGDSTKSTEVKGGFTLTPGATNAATVITADSSTDANTVNTKIPGLGTHVTTWSPSDIKLSVPQSTQNTLKTGDYQATINWMIAAKTA